MADLEDRIWQALKTVKFPGMSRDIVSFGFVENVTTDGGRVGIVLQMTTHNEEAVARVRDEVERAAAGVEGAGSVEVELKVSRPKGRAAAGPPGGGAQRAVSQDARLLPDVKHVVAVASGKGGVGKSTVAANLALALAKLGHRVGVLDADIYGPSMPMMFGITDRPRIEANRVIPFERYGVKVMSLGFVVDTDTPVIWRGPMVMKALEQLMGDVEWGELDYMIVDLPPGTGDAQLTITQRVPLSGAVVVTTPQDVALIDARKGLAMFRKVNVPVVGIVENMSTFVCPHCGEETDVFKKGGGERTARLLETPFLGTIPLDPEIVLGGDLGKPIVVARPEGRHAEAFRKIAEAVAEEAEARAAERPKMSIV
ncbi:MAG TPA: Mrp/NBP35 family ATP-binding protein [Thermoanaerobaculia bacterium]|nr:Mrp/NBP35 family ATP-binding protein [Thermoanaerobaculia bacterium]